MAAKASTTDVPACNSCDICRKRGRQITTAFRCLECELSLCQDCTFTHSWIPSCKTHTTTQAGAESSESLDVKRKTDEPKSVGECLDKESLDSFDACLDGFENVHVNSLEKEELYRKSKVSDSDDVRGTKNVLDSVDVCRNTESLASENIHLKREGLVNEDVCRNKEGAENVDVESGDLKEEEYPQFVWHFKFSPAREVDETVPDIRAVLLLECGVILATDWANCTLKSFDMEGRFLGDCRFEKSGKDDGRVHGLTLKDAKTVYVTLPSLKKIASITIDRISDGVQLTKTLHETKRRYFGIAHMARSEKLIVGTTNTVHILSYQCQVVREVGQFSRPYNMGVESPESVLVADTDKNCLSRIAVDGTVKRIDVGEKTRQLRGVTVDGRGNIFFAALQGQGVGWAKDEEPLRWVLTDRVQKAIGVHYQKTDTGHWLVVSENDGTIKVFRIK